MQNWGWGWGWNGDRSGGDGVEMVTEAMGTGGDVCGFFGDDGTGFNFCSNADLYIILLHCTSPPSLKSKTIHSSDMMHFVPGFYEV